LRSWSENRRSDWSVSQSSLGTWCKRTSWPSSIWRRKKIKSSTFFGYNF
jgi:hypothetical protein